MNPATDLPRPISVVVADDHPMYLEGVTDVLRSHGDLLITGTASGGGEALDLITRLEPDVAVLDMWMPDEDGLTVLTALEQRGSSTRVLFLSADVRGQTVYGALASGARGYLPKNSRASEICDAVVAVAAGETVLPDTLQSGIAAQIRARTAPPARPKLSPRELQVLRLAAEGLSAPRMARRMLLSEGTVKTHLQNAYEKLGVRDRAAAVAAAMRAGMLE